MGQGHPSSQRSLESNVLDKLAKETHYDKKEIKQLHSQFYTEVPSGFIPKEDFSQLTELMGIKDQFITSLVFNAFDRDRDSKISFDEFVYAMSVMTRGTADEKLEFAFKLYDLNHDGYILKSEMTRIVSALYQMLGDLVTLQGDFDTPVKLVDKIFMEMDTNGDGKLTLEEYKIGARKCPEIVNGLGLFF
ncbi:hypothetical protein FDP41_012262 [Naegleria fowleri]|uniref:EF-hand domain-containing protein n=1 Tax=Naegleria fowleri TaxID=5763 RepID=A0A6A5C836_NAEFO|nr:uncharacterized protein FDP41_012262 [Naegleria fowleri]KAF0981605.1 hypothetical protein FDP41_012262 [Naegleria fowleri]CAG4711885.1 unnamed protein product [Naegleria fowleri]